MLYYRNYIPDIYNNLSEEYLKGKSWIKTCGVLLLEDFFILLKMKKVFLQQECFRHLKATPSPPPPPQHSGPL